MLQQIKNNLCVKSLACALFMLGIFALQTASHAEPIALPVADQLKAMSQVPANTNATEEAEDISEIIVERKPFKIPKALKKTLISMGITGMTLSDTEGRIRLIAFDGQYINPCLSRTKALKAKTEGDQPTQTCRFAGGLGEAHALIASRSGIRNTLTNCDACLGIDSAARICNVRSNKYGCRTQKKECNTSCGQ